MCLQDVLIRDQSRVSSSVVTIVAIGPGLLVGANRNRIGLQMVYLSGGTGAEVCWPRFQGAGTDGGFALSKLNDAPFDISIFGLAECEWYTAALGISLRVLVIERVMSKPLAEMVKMNEDMLRAARGR